MLRLRERRWLDGASFDTERGSTSREGEPSLDKKSIPVQSPVSLGEELQWWPDKVGCTRLRAHGRFSGGRGWGSLVLSQCDGYCDTVRSSPQDGVKFVSIGALFSELVAVSSKGELYQWKWSEPEPYRSAQVGK